MFHLRYSLLFVVPVAFMGCQSDTFVEPQVSPSFSTVGQIPVHIVSGGGTVEVPSGRSTYAFHASVKADGAIDGQVEIHFSSVPVEVHGIVTCLSVVGNNAWLGAVITRSDAAFPGLAVGREIVWRVQDNGKGADAGTDRVRGFALRAADSCNNRPLFTLREWTNGNVQITSFPVIGNVNLCAAPSSDGIARFADANLEEAVRSELGVPPGNDLTCEQVATLTNLNAGDRGITSLVGIQNLTSLQSVELGGNSITDISPVSALTSLQVLGFFGNSITDISAVSGLTNLWLLELSNNSISDISPVGGLTNLTHLGIAANLLTDVSPLSTLTGLITLGLGNNFSLTDIGALVGLINLQELFLVNNHSLSNIQPLLDNTGLGVGDTVGLEGTLVSCADVLALQLKGVTVTSDCP